MAIWSWLFKEKPKQDYEALLQSLSLQIQERQQRLSEIKLRERRTTLAFTLYAIGLWLLYAALWWFDALAPLARLPALLGWTGGEDELLGEEEGENELVRLGVLVLLALPALVGPVGIYYIRRVVKLWYTRQEGFEEKHLRELRAKQRTTIEDIKTKSNYYSTKNLLEKYDETPKVNQQGAQNAANFRRRAFQPPVDPRAPPASPGSPSPSAAAVTPPRSSTLSAGSPLVAAGPAGFSAPGSPFPVPVLPPTPPRKQWYDRLADAVLGEEPGAAGAAGGDMSKYALVCEKCFAWNGLVDAKRWGDTQYKCPKCGHFNPAPNARSSAAAAAVKKFSPGPNAPATPSPLSHDSSAVPPKLARSSSAESE